MQRMSPRLTLFQQASDLFLLLFDELQRNAGVESGGELLSQALDFLRRYAKLETNTWDLLATPPPR